MSSRKVTPIPAGALNVSERREEAENALTQAMAIVDILQGAAAHGAIEPPANEESLAQTLDVVRALIDRAYSALWPPSTAEEERP